MGARERWEMGEMRRAARGGEKVEGAWAGDVG